jgi:hypothetical protein
VNPGDFASERKARRRLENMGKGQESGVGRQEAGGPWRRLGSYSYDVIAVWSEEGQGEHE